MRKLVAYPLYWIGFALSVPGDFLCALAGVLAGEPNNEEAVTEMRILTESAEMHDELGVFLPLPLAWDVLKQLGVPIPAPPLE